MVYFKRFFGHLKTTMTHKWWVFYYAYCFGYPWRGLIHDTSKLSPTEFLEGVKYWNGKRSPVLVAKEETGISYAWLHHRGRNKHHYEYWIDKLDDGGVPHKMPFKYVVEAVCDWLAACRTYTDNKDIFQAEYDWWEDRAPKVKMHDETKALVHKILWNLKEMAKYNIYWEGKWVLSERDKWVIQSVAHCLGRWEAEYNGKEVKYDERED